jgi:hypothetical protein
MLETLYKTRNPEGVPSAEAEYYELVLDQAENSRMYFVREMHGWWSEEQKRPIHNLKTLSPEEGYPTWDDAYKRYLEQRQHRARGGFVHSFSPHYYGGEEVRVRTHQSLKPAQ